MQSLLGTDRVRFGGRTITHSSARAVTVASARILSAFKPERRRPTILTAARPVTDSSRPSLTISPRSNTNLLIPPVRQPATMLAMPLEMSVPGWRLLAGPNVLITASLPRSPPQRRPDRTRRPAR